MSDFHDYVPLNGEIGTQIMILNVYIYAIPAISLVGWYHTDWSLQIQKPSN